MSPWIPEFNPEWNGGGIYFLSFDDGTDSAPIKIGRAVDVIGRLGTLQTGNPYPLSLVGAYACSTAEARRLEPAIHRFLGEHRLRGEWFHRCEQTRQLHDALADYQRRGSPRWDEGDGKDLVALRFGARPDDFLHRLTSHPYAPACKEPVK